MDALRTARDHWRERGRHIELGAVFVEEDTEAGVKLVDLCSDFCADFSCFKVYPGRFKDRAQAVSDAIGDDPALIFVDPWGWADADLADVARVINRPRRDVLIRVPSEINRFQWRFLGLNPDEAPRLPMEELIQVYRQRVKSICRVPYSADMMVPYGRRGGMACWLVVGGSHPQVLEVFRDTEAIVVGTDALEVSAECKAGDQTELFAPTETRRFHPMYERLWDEARLDAPKMVLAEVRRNGSITYEELAPSMLERFHVKQRQLAQLVYKMVPNQLTVPNMEARERSIKPHHVLRPAKAAVGRRPISEAS